jgi:hypothetical protein
VFSVRKKKITSVAVCYRLQQDTAPPTQIEPAMMSASGALLQHLVSTSLIESYT